MGNPAQPQHDDQHIFTAHRGDFEKVFFNDIGNFMVSEDMFEFFMPGCINYKSMALAFAMLSKLAGGVFYLIFSVYRGFPYKLFRLLSSSIDEAKAFAREFEAMPHCRLDNFHASSEHCIQLSARCCHLPHAQRFCCLLSSCIVIRLLSNAGTPW